MRAHPDGREPVCVSSYRLFEHVIDVLLDGEQTNGRCSVLWVCSPSRCLSTLHVHPDAEQIFCVVEGEQTLWIGDDVCVLRAGESRRAPCGVPHAFQSTGDGVLQMKVTSVPAGVECFVRAAGTTPASPAPSPLDAAPDMAAAAGVARSCGIELLGPAGMLPTELPGALRPLGRGSRSPAGQEQPMILAEPSTERSLTDRPGRLQGSATTTITVTGESAG